MRAPAGGIDQRRGGHYGETVALASYLLKHAPGRDRALPLPMVAQDFGLTVRQLQDVMAEAIEGGALIGSACSRPAGVFAIVTEQDLVLGTSHLRSRALSMLRRTAALKRSAAAAFGDEAAHLFDLSEIR